MATSASSSCVCGYRDSITGLLWTDAIITYFNETASASSDVVFHPRIAPSPTGDGAAGDTGSGQQAWAAIGDQLNDWEDAFGATYRSGKAYNNTQVDARTQSLALTVAPAQMQQRIVWGAEGELEVAESNRK